MLAMLANSIIQECQGSGVLPVMSRKYFGSFFDNNNNKTLSVLLS